MFQPRAYQKRAIDFTLKRFYLDGQLGAGLLMDPGLGKTACSLSILQALRDLGEFKKALIVAPLRVVYNTWPAEIRKWGFAFNFNILHGTAAARDKALATGQCFDIQLINPEGLEWLRKSKLWRPEEYCTLIVDESTKFKNWNAARTKALRGILKHFKRRIILTGTPSPNGMPDLFAQVYILDNGAALGHTVGEFRREYCRQGGFQNRQWLFRPEKKAQIERLLADMVVRLDARDHLDLPELVLVDVPVTLPEDVWQVYERFQDQLLVELADGKTLEASSAGALYSKCKQLANGGGYDEERNIMHVHNAKVDALSDIVEELQGKPVLVAYQYKHDLDRIRAKYPNAPAINGSTNQAETQRILEAWNKGEVPMLLAQPQAMSHGLNMQLGGCNHVVWFGLTDSLELYDQFNARVYRQGVQGKRVIIHNIIAQNTVDEAVQLRIAKKSEVQTSLLDALKRWGERRLAQTAGVSA